MLPGRIVFAVMLIPLIYFFKLGNFFIGKVSTRNELAVKYE